MGCWRRGKISFPFTDILFRGNWTLDISSSSSHAAFLLFDLTRPTTLDNLSEWTSIVRQKAGPIPIILVGSKLDLVTTNRKIQKEHGFQVAKKNKCHDYMEVSAKENLNVDFAFKALTEFSIRNLR